MKKFVLPSLLLLLIISVSGAYMIIGGEKNQKVYIVNYKDNYSENDEINFEFAYRNYSLKSRDLFCGYWCLETLNITNNESIMESPVPFGITPSSQIDYKIPPFGKLLHGNLSLKLISETKDCLLANNDPLKRTQKYKIECLGKIKMRKGLNTIVLNYYDYKNEFIINFQ